MIRPGRGGWGGGSASRYEGGDIPHSARPFRRRASNDPLTPFARIVEDHKLIRIETDGNGKLVEYVEKTYTHRYGCAVSTLHRPNGCGRYKTYRKHACSKAWEARHQARVERMDNVAAFCADQPGHTSREIAYELGYQRKTVDTYLRELLNHGRVDRDMVQRNGYHEAKWHAA